MSLSPNSAQYNTMRPASASNAASPSGLHPSSIQVDFNRPLSPTVNSGSHLLSPLMNYSSNNEHQRQHSASVVPESIQMTTFNKPTVTVPTTTTTTTAAQAAVAAEATKGSGDDDDDDPDKIKDDEIELGPEPKSNPNCVARLKCLRKLLFLYTVVTCKFH